jgi:hypothetical protein
VHATAQQRFDGTSTEGGLPDGLGRLAPGHEGGGGLRGR